MFTSSTNGLLSNSSEVISTGSSGIDWEIVSADTNAAAGSGYLVDCSAAIKTITLPASPAEGEMVGITDFTGSANTYNITVARNGKKIYSEEEDIVVDTNNSGFTLVYTDATEGWVVCTELNSGSSELAYPQLILSATLSANQTVSADTATTLAWNTTSTNIDTQYNTTTHVFTSDKTQIINIDVNTYVNSFANDDTHFLKIRKNGTIVKTTGGVQGPGSNDNVFTISLVNTDTIDTRIDTSKTTINKDLSSLTIWRLK